MMSCVSIWILFFMSLFPTCNTEAAPDISCDFERNTMCGWINSQAFDQLDWSLHQGPTLTANTGPDADHTLGTSQGTYIYIETSPPVNANASDHALLMSPVLPAPPDGGTGCLRFWYNMLGKTTGGLSVYLVDAGLMGGHKVWSITGEQGSQWLNAAIPVYHRSSFMFVIQGQIDRASLSDIALDDITYTILPLGQSPCRLDPLDARVQDDTDIFYLRFTTPPPSVATYTCEECAGRQCEVGRTNVTCLPEAPVCFSHIRETAQNERTVVKGCISHSDCEHGRLNDHDLIQCLEVDRTTATGHDLDCLFCCVGDLCNAGPDLVPSHFTWLEERTLPEGIVG